MFRSKGELIQRGGGSHRVGHDVDAQSLDLDLDLDPSPESDFFSHEPMNNPVQRRRAAEPDAPAPRRKRRNPVFWGFGIAFLLIWVFALGIFVGRGNIVNLEAFRRLERLVMGEQKTKLPPVVEVSGESKAPGPAEAAAGEASLTLYKSLKGEVKPETFPLKPVQEPATPTPAKSPAAPAKLPAASAPESKPADKGRQPEPPAREAKPAAGSTPAQPPAAPAKDSPAKDPGVKPVAVVSTKSTSSAAALPAKDPIKDPAKPKTSPAESPAADRFTVQVTAANDVQTSKNMVAKLKSLGYDAYYYEAEMNGRKYFRVRVGRFNTRAEADGAMKKLTGAGYENMFVTRQDN